MKSSEIKTDSQFPSFNVKGAVMRVNDVQLSEGKDGKSYSVKWVWESCTPEKDGDVTFAGRTFNVWGFLPKDGKSSFNPEEQDAGWKSIKAMFDLIGVTEEFDTENFTQAEIERVKYHAFKANFSTKEKPVKQDGVEVPGETRTVYKVGKPYEHAKEHDVQAPL